MSHKPEDTDLMFGLEYRGLLMKTLVYVLRMLRRKLAFEELVLFCARVLAIMSFRVPEFGKLIDSAITSGGYGPENVEDHESVPIVSWDTDIKEMKLTGDRAAISHHYLMEHDVSHVAQVLLLDWSFFHKALREKYGDKMLNDQEVQLNKILRLDVDDGGEIEDWKQRLWKHGHLFFIYEQQWMIMVLETIMPRRSRHVSLDTKTKIPWRYIPGYHAIVKSFVLELKHRSMSNIPESMNLLGTMMLANDALVVPMCKIALENTNVYDSDNVAEALDMVSSWIWARRAWPTARVVGGHQQRWLYSSAITGL
jgi:hypothetical protein